MNNPDFDFDLHIKDIIVDFELKHKDADRNMTKEDIILYPACYKHKSTDQWTKKEKEGR